MSEKDLKNTKNTLVDFMKKQAAAKVGAESATKISTSQQLKKAREDKEEKDKEELKEAKKESVGKASNFDQSRMVIRLIVESSTRYVLMIAILVGVAFLLVEAAPIIFEFFHGLLSRIIFGALK